MNASPRIEPGEIIVFTPFIGAMGGVERLLLSLSAVLHTLGRQCRVLCFEDTIGLASHAQWPLVVEQLQPKRSPRPEAAALQRYLREAQSAGACTPLLFDIRSAFYAGLAQLPPFVLHLTDPPSLLPTDTSKRSFSARRSYAPFASLPRPPLAQALRGEFVHRLNRRGARHAAKVIAMTDRIAAELRHLYGVDAAIIRPGVQLPPDPPPVVGPGRLRFLSVSRLEASKRLDWILLALAQLEAASPLLRERTDWQLDIVGQGSERLALEAFANTTGLGGRVVFHGPVSDAELEYLYAQAGLFLMPAVQGYGLPALEALARNVPVILHRDSGVAEILGDTAWVQVIDHEQADLARALSLMVTRLRDGALLAAPRPHIPTECEWVRSLGEACHWHLAVEASTPGIS